MDVVTIWEQDGEIKRILADAFTQISTQLKTDRCDNTLSLYGFGPFDPELQVLHAVAVYPIGVAVDNDSGQNVVHEILGYAVADLVALLGESVVFITETLIDEETMSYQIKVRIVFENSRFYDAVGRATDMLQGKKQSVEDMELLKQFFRS